MPPTSRSVIHELFYPDEEIIHSTGRIRNASYSFLSGSLLFQHTKIAVDHPSSSSISFEDIWNIYAMPIPLTPFYAGSYLSHLFIGEKNMFEWP